MGNEKVDLVDTEHTKAVRLCESQRKVARAWNVFTRKKSKGSSWKYILVRRPNWECWVEDTPLNRGILRNLSRGEEIVFYHIHLQRQVADKKEQTTCVRTTVFLCCALAAGVVLLLHHRSSTCNLNAS